MKVEVFPSELKGSIVAPGSKSAAQRFVACALLARGKSTIYNFPQSNDCKAALEIAQSLGAVVTVKGSTVHISGGFPSAFLSGIRNPKSEIACGESGLASRMFIPIAALHNQEITFVGEGSLLQRSFESFEKVLPQLGVKYTTNSGRLPVTVQGPIQTTNVEMDASDSSQFLTGLLMALSRAGSDSSLVVRKLRSRPYVEMTLQILEKFGAQISTQNLEQFTIQPALLSPTSVHVPGDWSGAAFLIVAGVLCSETGIRIENLNNEFTQSDQAIVSVLQSMNANILVDDNSVFVKSSEIKAFDFDANDCPDLFPPLVVLASFADGVSTLFGVKRLLNKESNRAKTLQQEFAKANIRITLRDDEMKIYPAHVRPAIINSHNDHRIAMAAAILGVAGARMTIKGAECVNKSFPEFFQVLQSVQGKVNLFANAGA
jgi:3-phosphoshikimate 1-carboxyvinyltransferase